MTLPFKLPKPQRAVPRGRSTAAPRREDDGTPVRQANPRARLLLFLLVAYTLVWPALALWLLSGAVSLACLPAWLGEPACSDFLAFDSALPAWLARTLGLGLSLLLGLSFLPGAARRLGRFLGGFLGWGRAALLLSPALLQVGAVSIPLPLPLVLLTGLFQPRLLAVGLRFFLVSLLLAVLLYALYSLWSGGRPERRMQQRSRHR